MSQSLLLLIPLANSAVLVSGDEGISSSAFCPLPKRCLAPHGSHLQALAVQSGELDSDAFLADQVVVRYASQTVATPVDAYAWASAISAHGRQGRAADAVRLYRQIRESSVLKPDSHVFVAALKACAAAEDLDSGKELHADIVRSDARPNLFVGNCLVGMYSKCRSLVDARRVFDALPEKDVVTWNSMISGYARQGLGQEALAVYAMMQQEGTARANRITFSCLLQACASVGALRQGQEIHAQVRRRRLESDVLVANSLVNMYAKCGRLEDARQVLDRLPGRDVVTWNSMISGYAQHGLGQEALALYADMRVEGRSVPDRVTFACLLQACGSVRALQQGMELHAEVRERGLGSDVVVGNCVVDMYAKCGSLELAREVFDKLVTRDVVTWSAMITGYAQQGLGEEALALYASMKQEGISLANRVTFMCLLQACTSVGALDQGRQVHAQVQERGLEADLVVGTCLVDMYAKCGSLEEARAVFDGLPARDVLTWTAMLAGYAQHELGREVLALYADMQGEGISPAEQTFVCLLKACASVGAVCKGRELHAQVQERGLEANVCIGNCLVSMYGKFAHLEAARSVFDALPTRDVVTWNALLNGYAEHGHGRKSMQCFDEMRRQGVQPNESTFICLLVACSHAGLVDEGWQYFKLMVEEHGIAPYATHYNCMVDLLGRSGRLEEAETMMVQAVPSQDSIAGWTSLLSACKSHGDRDRGTRCFNRLIELEPGNATAYAILSNIYANASRLEDAYKVESLRKSAGAHKKPAKAYIEVKQKVHQFTVGQEGADVSCKVRRLNYNLTKEGGHVPQTELVLKAVSEQEKEDALCGHAEKLALAYGLLNTPDGTTLLVTKNLRMCNDCHSSTKIMSHLEQREIIVRDAHRVHRFLNGYCSCGERH